MWRSATREAREMATKHMNAAPGDFAETVLMPGDPLRAQYIADTFLGDVRRVTDVRNMWGFTGNYKGQAVSVMAHGMGIPSASIYCNELLADYGVKRVIRVGSCGTSHPDVKLRDIIIGMGACTDSGVNRMRFGGYDFAAIATFDLVRKAVAAAAAHEVRYHVGNLFSADLFYTPDPDMFATMAKCQRRHSDRRRAVDRRPADHVRRDDSCRPRNRRRRLIGHGFVRCSCCESAARP
jgi:purine-nucleoside phosphorylase